MFKEFNRKNYIILGIALVIVIIAFSFMKKLSNDERVIETTPLSDEEKIERNFKLEAKRIMNGNDSIIFNCSLEDYDCTKLNEFKVDKIEEEKAYEDGLLYKIKFTWSCLDHDECLYVNDDTEYDGLYYSTYSYFEIDENQKIISNKGNSLTKILRITQMKEYDSFATITSNSKDLKLDNIIIRDDQLIIEYPTIKGKGLVLKNVTKQIANNVKNTVSELSKSSVDDGCISLRFNKAKNSLKFNDVYYLSYEIFESEDYISIIEIYNKYTGCSTREVSISEVYVMDKDGEKSYTQEELFEGIKSEDFDKFLFEKTLTRDDFGKKIFSLYDDDSVTLFALVKNNDVELYSYEEGVVEHIKR